MISNKSNAFFFFTHLFERINSVLNYANIGVYFSSLLFFVWFLLLGDVEEVQGEQKGI